MTKTLTHSCHSYLKGLIFCCLLFAGISASEISYAQTKPKARTEQEVHRKKKEKKRKRRRGKQYTVKKRSRLLERFYFGSQSKQIQRNPGYISLQPKKQSYGSMQANEVRNPQVKNLKSFQQQKNGFRYQSRRIQKSYGSEPVLSGNKKMLYKFNSAMAQEFSGDRKYKSPRRNFRKDSRKQSRSKGDLILQPKALQKNYNEDKQGSDRYASRSRMKSENRKESDYRSRSAEVQKYSGSIVRARKATKLSGKYNSLQVQQSKGDLKRRDVKSAFQQRASNASVAANYSGETRIESKTGKKNYEKYLSRKMSNYEGSLRTLTPKQRKQAIVGNTMMMADFRGDTKAESKAAREKWNRKFSKYNVNYSGNLRGLTKKQKNQAMEGTALMMADYRGDVKQKSRSARNRWSQKASEYSGYQGDIKTLTPRQRRQAIAGNSAVMAEYRGDFKAESKSKRERWFKHASAYSGNYQGDLRGLTKKQKDQVMEGDAMLMAEYTGDFKARSKAKQEKWYKKASSYTGNYQGDLKGFTKKQKQQSLEGDAMMLAGYRGEIKTKGPKRLRAESQRKAQMTGSYQGDLKTVSERRSKADREGRALELASYQGDIKALSKNRAKAESERKAMELAQYQGEIKLPSRDYRELNYEFMSKVVHNYRGELKALSKNQKDNYYRELSARNQQVTGNFRLKYKFVKDLEYQISSARVHGYEGGPKTGLITRIWLNLFDKEKYKKANNTDKKPKYDTREAEIWY